jgi:hypothetical protein
LCYNVDNEREVIQMVKCPYCGSSAQVKENTPFISREGQYIDAKYKCGCGCYFDTESDLDDLLEANADVLKRLKER